MNKEIPMSFRCQDCGEPRPNKLNPNEYRPTKMVTRTRTLSGDFGGTEIAEEKNLCSSCATKRKAQKLEEAIGGDVR
jgi:hypothetical protein